MSYCSGPDCEHHSHTRAERRENFKIKQPQRVKTREDRRRDKKRQRQNRKAARV